MYSVKMLNYFPRISSVKVTFFKINKQHELQYYVNFDFYQYWDDTRCGSWFRHCATSQKVSGSILDFVIGNFFIDIILPAAL